MRNENGELKALRALEQTTLFPLRAAVKSAWQDNTDAEKALTSAYRKVFERPEHSVVVASRRRATSLWHRRQADLCYIVQLAKEIETSQEGTAAAHWARSLRHEAQTAFLMVNDGFLHGEFVRKLGFQNTFESEDVDSARAMILQEAREGLVYGMTKFDAAKGANALTYCGGWARQRVMRAMEKDGRVISYKHNESTRRSLVQAMKELDENGQRLDVAVIADKVGISPKDVLSLLPNVGNVGRLDAPVRDTEGGLSVGDLVVDEGVDMLSAHLSGEMRVAVTAAVSEIEDPMQRTVIEMLYGVNGREVCTQSALYDGIYIDTAGNKYAAKACTCNAEHWKVKGEIVVEQRLQSELSRGLRNGEYEFVPGTPQAAELVRVGESMGRANWAPTSGSIQDAFVRAEARVRLSEHLEPWANGLRYRGDNEIENSEAALIELRQALTAVGACTANEAEHLKAGTLSGDGDVKKGSARILGEKHGLLDPATGRRTQKMRDLLDRTPAFV